MAENQQMAERIVLVDRDYAAEQIADHLEGRHADDSEAVVDRVFDKFRALWDQDHMYDRIGDMITEAYEQAAG